jgi:hypothetical protein
MTTQIKFKFFLIPMIVVGLILTISTAQALDYKTISGNACQPYFANTEARIDNRYDGAYNNSTVSTWVSCPIVRDSTFDTDGPSCTTWVRTHGATSNSSFTGVLGSMNTTAGFLGSQSKSWAGGWRWTSFLVSGTGRGAAWAPYIMYIRIPPRSRVYSYTVCEQVPTD